MLVSAPSPAAIARPDYADLKLGRVSDPSLDLIEIKLVTDESRPAGPLDGYATLKDAQADLSQATAGDYHPAAGIFRHRTAEGDRYFAQSLDMTFLEQSPHGWDGPYRDKFTYLEDSTPAEIGFKPYRRGELAQELVSIVDGTQTITLKR